MKVETQAQLLLEFHSKLLVIRRIERIIQSDEMIDLFPKATREGKDEIVRLIYQFDFEGLRANIMKLRSRELELMGVRELRAKAQKLGVRNYNHLTKGLLLSAIVRIQNERNQAIARQIA